jgi:homoserine/homoserine lactone efflux protein
LIAVDALLLFSVTTFFVVLAPGPAAIAETAEAASNGFKRSLFVILGIAVANVVFFILSAAGIGAVIVASDLLFSIVKWVGIIYLLYLGLGALFSKSSPLTIKLDNKDSGNLKTLFLRGFFIEFSNPKALLYFTALLPQFIDVEQAIVPQVMIFTVITIILDLSCYNLYSYIGWKAMNLGSNPLLIKIINKAAGVMLVSAGLIMMTIGR